MEEHKKQKHFRATVVRHVRYPGWSGDVQARVDLRSESAKQADLHINVQPGSGLAAALQPGVTVRIVVE